MELLKHMQQLESEGQSARVGLVGCGQMGSGMVHVTHKMPGLKMFAIADIDANRPLNTLKALGIPLSKIVVTSKQGEAEDALSQGKYVVTEDAVMLARLENLDAIVEATGNTEIGAQVAWNCVFNQKTVVMLNVETDVTVGLILARLAEKAGSVYTVASGDEPAVCKMLYDFSNTLGFEVVTIGKGKNNVINFDSTPDACRAEAESKNMNPYMLSAFKDGTKTMVEMCAVSNATGMLPDKPGMHGPKVDVPDLNKVLVPKADGGILSRRGCVEYSTGKVAPGVFAIVTSDDPRIRTDMKFVAMGEGPYYTFYRPFHLCNIETPIAVCEAIVYGESTIVPKGMYSEVITIAKRDLQPGEKVGHFGGPDFYGTIYSYTEACKVKGIPLGVVPEGKVTKPIRKGDLLTSENFQPDTSMFVYKLRQMQDDMLAKEML